MSEEQHGDELWDGRLLAGRPIKAMELLGNILVAALIVVTIWLIAVFIATPEDYW